MGRLWDVTVSPLPSSGKGSACAGSFFSLRRDWQGQGFDGRGWANFLHIFEISPQDFCHAPGLCNASTWALRCVAIENFRDVS